jgi:uncharacterized protein YbaR (Trm112 family)
VAARRYRGRKLDPHLKVLLAVTLLKQHGPIRLPGVRRRAGRALTCPKDGDELVDNGDGTCYCQRCGRRFEIIEG